jgi:hypothetical protein
MCKCCLTAYACGVSIMSDSKLDNVGEPDLQAHFLRKMSLQIGFTNVIKFGVTHTLHTKQITLREVMKKVRQIRSVCCIS